MPEADHSTDTVYHAISHEHSAAADDIVVNCTDYHRYSQRKIWVRKFYVLRHVDLCVFQDSAKEINELKSLLRPKSKVGEEEKPRKGHFSTGGPVIPTHHRSNHIDKH